MRIGIVSIVLSAEMLAALEAAAKREGVSTRRWRLLIAGILKEK